MYKMFGKNLPLLPYYRNKQKNNRKTKKVIKWNTQEWKIMIHQKEFHYVKNCYNDDLE